MMGEGKAVDVRMVTGIEAHVADDGIERLSVILAERIVPELTKAVSGMISLASYEKLLEENALLRKQLGSLTFNLEEAKKVIKKLSEDAR